MNGTRLLTHDPGEATLWNRVSQDHETPITEPNLGGWSASASDELLYESELRPGARAGEYIVANRLAAGGCGTVYVATHRLTGERVALKVLHREMAFSAKMRKRFLFEARVARMIEHPNVVKVLEAGELRGGIPFIVMELLEGESLGTRLEREPLAFLDALDVLEQVCEALAAGHEQAIVHRDLKPDNIFLLASAKPAERVKVLDFGLAKADAPRGDQASRTQTGTILGSPNYMSPEQARGAAAGPASDIYSLGVIAYKLFLGSRPFLAETVPDLLAKHIHDPPPTPSALWPRVPPPLENLLLGMLEKDPARRPSLKALRHSFQQLRRFGDRFDHRPSQREDALLAGVRPPRRWRLLLGCAGALVTAILLVAGWWLTARRPVALVEPAAAMDRPETRASEPPVPASPLAAPQPPAPANAGGVLAVLANASNATIRIDRHVVAQSAPSARIDVRADTRHEVLVTAPGRRPFHRVVYVGKGATVNLGAALAPLATRASATHGAPPAVEARSPVPATTVRRTVPIGDLNSPVNPFVKE
jgi:tRNA A-37 threonylcarbamoyl transferase component Bud32